MFIDYKIVGTTRDHVYKKYVINENGDYEETALVIEIHHPCYTIIRQIIDTNKCNYKPHSEKKCRYFK